MPNWNGDWIEVKSYDVEQSGSAGVGDSGGLEVRLEYDTGTPITRHIAMLFSTSGVTGTVSSATLTVNVDATDLPTGTPGTAFIMRVYAIDVGDTTALPTTIEDYLALSKTAAFGSKTFYGEDATTSVDVDVTAVVQEIFDRMDWFSGAGIGLLFEIQSGSGQPYYMTLSSIDPSSLDINTATVIDLAAGSFVLTGNAATFVSQYQIALATGTFNLSGIAMLPQVITPLAAGSFVLTGVNATFQTVYSVDLAAGAFTLTGVAMLPQVSVPMGTGTFVFTGAAAGIETSYLLALDAGSFALTGNALALSYVVTAGTGSFTLTGNSITTPVTVPMGAGSFVLTGSEAQIAATSVIDLSAGSFTLSGAAMVPQVSTPLATGAFTLSGQAMVPVSHIILEMAAGSFTMTGQTVLPSVSIPIGAGSFTLTGVATGADSYTVTMGTGEFLMTGQQMDIESIGAIDCLAGSFVVTGSEITLQSHTIIELESGSFELDGNSMFVTDPLAQTGGSVFTKKKALLDCGCGCLNCDATCCPGVTIAEDFAWVWDEVGEGELTCPTMTIQTPPDAVDFSLSNTTVLPGELLALHPTACYAYEGLVEIFDDYVVEGYVVGFYIFCTADGELHGYVEVDLPVLPGIDALTWYEMPAGIECPDCTGQPSGTPLEVRIWIDIPAHCPECDFSLYTVVDDIPVGPCDPDTLFSIRFYFRGTMLCP